MLAEARTEIAYADHKAASVLAALGIGFGALLGGLFAGQWRPTDLQSWGEVSWWIGGACALGSVLGAALAIWPRIQNTDASGGIHYWGHVARFSSVDELSRHLDEKPVGHAQRTRNQLWQISRIVVRKYTMIRCALVLGGAAVVFFLVAGLSVLATD